MRNWLSRAANRTSSSDPNPKPTTEIPPHDPGPRTQDTIDFRQRATDIHGEDVILEVYALLYTATKEASHSALPNLARALLVFAEHLGALALAEEIAPDEDQLEALLQGLAQPGDTPMDHGRRLQVVHALLEDMRRFPDTQEPI